MSDAVELQGCEHCSGDFPIDTMTLMEGCWFCAGCVQDWQATFDACDHKWVPHVNEMGDDGQYCERCCGFMTNEDLAESTIENKQPADID